jgi:PBP1b-binding outer membrane lipoprotein LpoB
MKTVKITLSLIVLATIATVLIRGCIKEPESDVIQLPENTSTIIIKQKIDSLKEMPISSFCDKFHIEIKNYIEMDYTDQRLGENATENDQWKKILSSNLYAAYTDKFISQAFYVFKGSEWQMEKLNFIRKEYQALQKNGYQSGLLEKNSITDQIFNAFHLRKSCKNIFLLNLNKKRIERSLKRGRVRVTFFFFQKNQS